MISAKQTKNIVDYMFSGIPGFVAPTSTFTAVPSTYTEAAVPGSILVSGAITPNDGVITSWAITVGTNPVPLATGTDNLPTTSITGGSIPAVAGTTTYYLTVYYTDTASNTQSFILSSNVIVTVEALYGQLALPGDNIVIPADLTAPIIATLTTADKITIVNVLGIVAANTGRIVFVIPDSYGTVNDIEDNTNSSVLSQFNIVVDAPNAQKIYVGVNAVTPATYYYKFVYAPVI